MGHRVEIVRAWEIYTIPHQKRDSNKHKEEVAKENDSFDKDDIRDPKFNMKVEAAFCLLFPDQFLRSLEENLEIFIPPQPPKGESSAPVEFDKIVGGTIKAACEAMHPLVEAMKEVYSVDVLAWIPMGSSALTNCDRLRRQIAVRAPQMLGHINTYSSSRLRATSGVGIGVRDESTAKYRF